MPSAEKIIKTIISVAHTGRDHGRLTQRHYSLLPITEWLMD